MKKREFKRQLFHALNGIVFVALLYFDIIGLITLTVLFVLSLICSVASLRFKIPVVTYLLRSMEREQNLRTFPGKGVVFYLLGCAVAVAVFDRQIALASIMILALGDSFSHYIGRFYGRIKHPFTDRREVEGWLSGILMATLGAMLFVPWYAALAASVVGMTVEMAEIKVLGQKVDDNLTIPIVAGIVLLLIL